MDSSGSSLCVCACVCVCDCMCRLLAGRLGHFGWTGSNSSDPVMDPRSAAERFVARLSRRRAGCHFVAFRWSNGLNSVETLRRQRLVVPYTKLKL